VWVDVGGIAACVLTVVSVRILALSPREQPLTVQETPRTESSRVDEILRAACRVVVSEGAHALRIGNVAREAGVSRTLVHYYFTTRQELLRAAFAYAEERRVAALERELAEIPTGAARAERALLRSVEPELAEAPALWNEVWSSLRDDAELRPLVQRCYRLWAERIVALLEEGKEDGSVAATVDAGAAGWRLAATADGLDSIVYLGLLERDEAAAVIVSCVARETRP
jgi:AcrR family transcriptional regulator